MSAQKSQHSAGWYAGALVFWLLSAWLTTVGLSSIIPQIFSPAGEPAPQASETCVPGLRTLRQELLARMSQNLGSPARATPEATRAWFGDWDQRLYRAKPACQGDARSAWTELNRLRYGLAALHERFEREELPHLERLDQLLGPAPAAEAHALNSKEPIHE